MLIGDHGMSCWKLIGELFSCSGGVRLWGTGLENSALGGNLVGVRSGIVSCLEMGDTGYTRSCL